MTNITYKELVINKEEILALYLDNKWFAYTNEPDQLFRGLDNSLDRFGAYDGDKLVGLVRTIGDSETIVHIQDILVLESYHRKGIGKQLIQIIFDKYPTIRQILLMTDNSDKTRSFYESVGMVSYDKVNGVGFKLKREND